MNEKTRQLVTYTFWGGAALFGVGISIVAGTIAPIFITMGVAGLIFALVLAVNSID